MSNIEFTSSLRVTSETDDISRFVSMGGLALLAPLGKVSANDNESALIVDIDVDSRRSFEEILDKSIAVAAAARETPGFPESSAISVWIVISSSQEFVGLVIPEDTVRRASEVRASFVFSIYCSQPDMEVQGGA